MAAKLRLSNKVSAIIENAIRRSISRQNNPMSPLSLRSVRTGRLQLKDTSLLRATSLALTIP